LPVMLLMKCCQANFSFILYHDERKTMATPNKRQRRQAPKNTSNFKGGGVIVGRLAIQQTRKFNSLRNNSSSKLDGPKSWTGQGQPKRGCSLNSKRDRKVKLLAGGEGGLVQQNFQHLPEHVMNANMKRRGQKRRERSEKGGYILRGGAIYGIVYP